ncbi:16071_t:CDS:2, partial [Dentiscutata heterogama]
MASEISYGAPERKLNIQASPGPSACTIEFVIIKRGHVAWGFEVDNSGNYIYGSDDGPSGGDGTPKKWNQSNGTRSDMMNWFKNQNYDYYNCENVPNSAVGAATNMIATVKTQPYY